MKKIAKGLLIALLLNFCILNYVYAHVVEDYTTNIQTDVYKDGKYVSTTFSLGGNDHPALFVSRVIDGKAHIGAIPKVSYIKRGPYGEVLSEGESYLTTIYDATYRGWLNCISL